MSNNPVSIELTPHSKSLINVWGRDKAKQVNRTIDTWLDRIAAWTLRETMKAFDDGKQPGGQPWPANPDFYAQWKAQFGATKPGFLSGGLKGSFSHNINYSAKEARVGSPKPYARAFNYGKRQTWAGVITGPGGRNPAWFMFHGMKPRPFFPEKRYGEQHGARLFEQLLRQKVS